MYTQQQFRFENRTSHSHGNLIPNSFIELENGTKACKGTTLFFEPYAGNEDSLVRFQGKRYKGKLVFQVKGESPRFTVIDVKKMHTEVRNSVGMESER